MNEDLWDIELYYGEQARPPRRPGALALHATNRAESGARAEALAARRRPEIGRIAIMPPVGVEPPAWAAEIEQP